MIVTTEGKRLTSPHMRYMQAQNEMSSDTAFTLVEPGRSLSGVGFRADPQLTRIVVLKAGEGARQHHASVPSDAARWCVRPAR